VINSASDVPSRPLRIMVINDSIEILDLLRDILESEGFEAVTYSYALRDLVEVKQVKPDLIILDLLIGSEDFGWQFLQKLHLDPETATLPVVICTAAVSTVRDLEGHLHEKGVGVVLKPFDIDDLLEEIRATLHRAGHDLPTEEPNSLIQCNGTHQSLKTESEST